MKSSILVSKDFIIDKAEGNLFSGFVEHLGRSVYNGIYEPEHPQADENGFRKDVIDLVKELDMPLTRYPGGNFVSGYNWLDGIGPVEQRPVRPEYAWKATESNRVGIDEFMKWCRSAGTEPMYTVNLGTNTPKAAQEVVEYCNFPGGTYYSELRKKNGADLPYNIKYWCLGNEMDGEWQIGHKTAYEYGRIAHEAAKMMKWADPEIKLCACGSSNAGMPTFGAWDEEILRHLYNDVDYLSIHAYFGNADRNFPKFYSAPERLDRQIEDIIACCDAVGAEKKSRKKIMLALDEWNVWYRGATPKDNPWKCGEAALEEIYDMADVLVTGGLLLSILDHCDRLKIACIAQTCNVISPIMTENRGRAWRQTTYYPLRETSRYGRGVVLRSVVDSPVYNIEEVGDVKYLRSTCVWQQEENTVSIFAINRSGEEMDFSAILKGFAPKACIYAKEIRNDSPDAVNTADVESVKPEDIPAGRIKLENETLTAKLAPYSWNILRVSL